MSSPYEKSVLEAAASNPIWGNGDNGHSQTMQVVKEEPDPASKHKEPQDAQIVRIRSHEIEQIKRQAKDKKKCAECGSSKTTPSTSGQPHWYTSKNPQKPGLLCNLCYFRLWRQECKKKNGNLLVGMTSKLDLLQPLFERQNKALAQKQAAIKKRLAEIEKEKAILLRQAQAFTEHLGTFDLRS